MSSVPMPRSKQRFFDDYRENHHYGHPTVGRTYTAVFTQPASGQTRTVQIIRYSGSETWKARIKETGNLITRMNQPKTRRVQWEFVSPLFAKAEISEYMQQTCGMQQLTEWREGYPEAPGREYGAPHSAGVVIQ